MITTLLAIAFLAAMLWLARMLSQREAPVSDAPRPRSARHDAHGRRTRRPTPQPVAPDWDSLAREAPPAALTPGGMKAKVRDRYIQARFPGVLRGSADLLQTEYVIKLARQYFDEGKLDRAHELFALAIGQAPAELPLRLAQLEIAFLTRDAGLFTTLARSLRDAHRDIDEWGVVCRLGRAIAPDEPLFGSTPGERGNDHHGPWPEMPNWIQASWDLTPEVLAADFHYAIAAPGGDDTPAAVRRAA